MSIINIIEEAVEDLITLEVATLTNKIDDAIELQTKLTQAQQTKLDKAREDLSKAKTDLVNLIGQGGEKKDIRAKRKVVRENENTVGDMEKALGIYDPKDIFSKIRKGLETGELVAYSRFELEGDSVNFINNKEELKEIVTAHKEMVTSSQEARKSLFDSALKIIRKG